MRRKSIVCFFLAMAVLPSLAQEFKILTTDGAWCWFSDPRAIYLQQKKGTIVTGWINKSGNVYAASLHIKSRQQSQQRLYKTLEIDDHDNPAFLELPNGDILAQYTWHNGKPGAMGVIQHITNQPGDINSFSEPVVFKPYDEALVQKFVRQIYSYANPMRLRKEGNTVYSFGRWIGYKPNFIKSSDRGNSWSDPKVVITSKELDVNNRPYVKYCSDGRSRIHLLFSDGHPNNEPLNSVYYCYYENNAFWRADGSKICSVDALPFSPEDASVVYKATAQTGKAWIFDIAIDKKGRPVVAYTRYPSNKDHIYHYAIYNKGVWEDHELIHSGGWFPDETPGRVQREQNYSGGISIDPSDPSQVYFSHQLNGVFEISKGHTKDLGATWQFSPVTRNSSQHNVRPVIPRYKGKKDKTVLLWMRVKKYLHYTDYDSDILYQVLP